MKVEKLTAKYFKLMTGLSVLALAGYIEETKSWYLEKPLSFTVDVNKRGQSQLLFYPFLPTTLTAQKHVILDESKVLYAIDVLPEIGDYIKKFSLEYYDVEVSLKLTDISKKKQEEERNQDVLSLLRGLEKNNDDGNGEDGDNGSGSAA